MADDSSKVVLALGRAVRGPDNVTEWEVVRNLSQAEWDSALEFLGRVLTLNAAASIGKAEEARVHLLEVSKDCLESLTLSFDNRLKWAKSIEDWLTQFVAVRRRFVTAITDAFGADAGAAAERRFEAAYLNDPHYRLAWELRNLSEHGHLVLDLTSKSSSYNPSGPPIVEWNLPLEAVTALLTGRPLQQLGALWAGTHTVEMGPLIGRATDRLLIVMASVWSAHEVELIADAEAVIRLVAEVSVSPGAAMLFSTDFAEPKTLGARLNPLTGGLATAVLRTMSESREIVASQGSYGD